MSSYTALGMQQESIASKKYGDKVKEYQNQIYQLTQNLKDCDLENGKKILFGNASNAVKLNNWNQSDFGNGIDNDIYVSHLQSNNNLLKAKQDLYSIEGFSHQAAGNIAQQNRTLDGAISKTKDNNSEFNQTEGLIAQMQRRINLNKCLLYLLFGFIFLGFVFIIVYKVFL